MFPCLRNLCRQKQIDKQLVSRGHAKSMYLVLVCIFFSMPIFMPTLSTVSHLNIFSQLKHTYSRVFLYYNRACYNLSLHLSYSLSKIICVLLKDIFLFLNVSSEVLKTVTYIKSGPLSAFVEIIYMFLSMSKAEDEEIKRK